jgi:DNA-binding Lrp family transcriptional regulator
LADQILKSQPPSAVKAGAFSSGGPELGALEKKFIHLLSSDLGTSPRPYEALAEKLGLTEEQVFSMIDSLTQKGVIRRLGAVVVHQRSGFSSNAMVVWDIAEENLEQAGKVLAAQPFVSHCYYRTPVSNWPYRLYTMIHARSESELSEMVGTMAALVEASGWCILNSLKELKKTSLTYFPCAFDLPSGGQ